MSDLCLDFLPDLSCNIWKAVCFTESIIDDSDRKINLHQIYILFLSNLSLKPEVKIKNNKMSMFFMCYCLYNSL